MIHQNIAGYSTDTSENLLNQDPVFNVILDKSRLASQSSKTDYNAHYQTNGYHPLVAFDCLTGDFLKAELRSDNVYTSYGIGTLMERLFEHYNQMVPVSNIFVH